MRPWSTSSLPARQQRTVAGLAGWGIVLGAAVVLVCACSQGPPAPAAKVARAPLYYRNPMNPTMTSDRPAKDSMGMDYVPVYAPDGGSAEVRVEPGLVQQLGVRTVVAESSPLARDIELVGAVAYNESSIHDLYAATGGWIDAMTVHAVGDPVRAGEVLFQLYSPSLSIVDQQYLTAVAGGSDPVNNPYARGLGTLGLTDEMITEVREHRRAVGHIAYRAAVAGVVTALNFRQGAFVTQGANVMRVASIDPAWIMLSVPQAMVSDIVMGTSVSVTVAGSASNRLTGHVDFEYEDLDPVTRTARVRVVVPNPDHALKADMYVTAVVHKSLSDAVVNVPSDAVIRDEHEDRVIVALGNGRFAPRIVELGPVTSDRIAILHGLSAGEHVVTAGLFLLDSETQLSAGLAHMRTGERTTEQREPPAQTTR